MRAFILLPNTLYQGFTILGPVTKQFWWPSKVSRVMCINTALRIMGVLLIWAPCSLILKHVEQIGSELMVDIVQITLQV